MIAIKGYSMPKDCINCVMQFGGWCGVSPPEVDERVAETVEDAINNGKPDWCPLVEIDAEPMRHGQLDEDKPLTNGDRIRQMTDEELAEFILESRPICKLCKKHDEICEGAYHECWNGIDDWLKQEAKEDDR